MNYITFVDFKTSELLGNSSEVYPTGSRYTCNPPPMDTDADFLVVCHNRREANKLVEGLKALGWTLPEQRLEVQEKTDDYNSLMTGSKSFPLKHPKSIANLIVTGDYEFAAKWNIATAVCKKLNLMSRDDRVMVFRAIRDGRSPE